MATRRKNIVETLKSGATVEVSKQSYDRLELPCPEKPCMLAMCRCTVDELIVEQSDVKLFLTETTIGKLTLRRDALSPDYFCGGSVKAGTISGTSLVLTDVDFEHCTLEGVTVARMQGARFKHCELQQCVIKKSNGASYMQDCRFDRSIAAAVDRNYIGAYECDPPDKFAFLSSEGYEFTDDGMLVYTDHKREPVARWAGPDIDGLIPIWPKPDRDHKLKAVMPWGELVNVQIGRQSDYCTVLRYPDD